MKKILLALVLLLAANLSIAQTNQWFTISYKYYSGPVSPQYQKMYTITVNYDKSTEISYHEGMDKMAPQVVPFTISKTNHKKISALIKKLGILDGTAPKDSADGKIGGPEKTITISYGNPNPNLDQPTRQVSFKESSNSSDDVKKLFALMEKVVTKKIWKELEKKDKPKEKTDK